MDTTINGTRQAEECHGQVISPKKTHSSSTLCIYKGWKEFIKFHETPLGKSIQMYML